MRSLCLVVFVVCSFVRFVNVRALNSIFFLVCIVCNILVMFVCVLMMVYFVILFFELNFFDVYVVFFNVTYANFASSSFSSANVRVFFSKYCNFCLMYFFV